MPQFIDENTRSSSKLANAIADLGLGSQVPTEGGVRTHGRVAMRRSVRR